MPNHKNQNRFKYGENDNQSSSTCTYESQTRSEQNPHKRYIPNSTDEDSDPNISDLGEILENASSNPKNNLSYSQQHSNKKITHKIIDTRI